jgi:hypothetical protein
MLAHVGADDRPSCDVLADRDVVGRIMRANAVPVGARKRGSRGVLKETDFPRGLWLC